MGYGKAKPTAKMMGTGMSKKKKNNTNKVTMTSMKNKKKYAL
jgi:hypothetical protein